MFTTGCISTRTACIYNSHEEREIREREEAQKALQENEKRLQLILESNSDPVVIYDEMGNTLYVNPAFSRIFGWEFDQLRGP